MVQTKYGINPRQEMYRFSMQAIGLCSLAEVHIGLQHPGAPHRHGDQIQVVFLLEGQGEMEIEKKTWLLKPGDAIIIPCGSSHQLSPAGSRGRAAFLDLRIPPDADGALTQFFQQREDVRKSEGNPEALLAAAERLRLCQPLQDPDGIHSGILSGIWAAIDATFGQTLLHRPAEEATDFRLSAVEMLMRDHMQGPASVEELAKMVDISASQLTRLFRKHHNISPAGYYRRLRLRHAAELLRTSIYTVGQIAEACGFHDPNHFSKLFHDLTGLTATAYRKLPTTIPIDELIDGTADENG